MTTKGAILGTIMVLLMGFILLPIIIPIGISFSDTPFVVFPPKGFTLRWYAKVLSDPEVIASFWLSLKLAVSVCIMSLMLGTAASLALTRHRFVGRSVIQGFLLSPLIFPALVTGIALLQFFSTLNSNWTFAHLLIGHVVITIPYVVRSVSASLLQNDPSLEEAARTLGAPPIYTFIHVTVPQIAPGLLAGAILSFVVSFDNYSVSMWLTDAEHTPIPMLVIRFIIRFFDPSVAALSSLMILVAIAIIITVEKLLGLQKFMGV
jgi:putative spermidine/putrescine transport system permease protein